MNLKQTLKSFGLSEAEIQLYLAGLQTGEAPLSEIAKNAGIKRGSAYLTAKNLEEKGLMGNFKMKSGLKFVSSPPQVLLRQAQRNTENITKIIPELKAIQKGSEDKPTITVYEGHKGYLSVLEDSLNMYSQTIRAIGSLGQYYDVITYEYDDTYYIPTRIKNKIKLKGLYFEDKAVEKFPKERDAKELRQVKILPNQYYQPSLTFIYRNTVVTFSTKKELIAVKIVSKDIAQSEKAKFDLIWDLLEK